MSVINNLIDLSNDETESFFSETAHNDSILIPSNKSSIKTIESNKFNNFVESTSRDSLDNNPFDKVQKQANLLDDPFEVAELAASRKNVCMEEVHTENLLLLPEDDIKEVTPFANSLLQGNKSNYMSDLSGITKCSPDYQSTPINLYETDLTSLATGAETSSGVNKLLKNDNRNRLLKFSLTNSSTFNSPSRGSRTSDDGSPSDSFFAAEARRLSQRYIDSPSSKDESCDDLMNTKPNWIDSENEQSESDLEMMKIPMLEHIDDTKLYSPLACPKTPEIVNGANSEGIINKSKSSLAIIRKRIQETKNKTSYELNEMDSVLSELKNMIIESKVEPNDVLENLKKMIADKTSKNDFISPSVKTKENNEYESPPQIIRQGTFDLDLDPIASNSNLHDADKGVKINVNNENQKIDFPLDENKLSPHINDIIEHLGKFLGGTQNVNIVQASVDRSETAVTPENPTYIVVMGTPRNTNATSSTSDRKTILRRSQSFSSPSNKKPTNTHSQEKINTSKISVTRRNSMSCTSWTTNVTSHQNSICNSSRTKSIITNKQQHRRTEVTPSKPHFKADLHEKTLKLKVGEQIKTKGGPMKATIPVKKFASKITGTTPRISYTPCSTKPQISTASSTSMVESSPVMDRKKKLSFLLETPNPRSNVGVNRRRTLTELRSPLKRTTFDKKSTLQTPVGRVDKITRELKTIKKLKIPSRSTLKNKENAQLSNNGGFK